MTWLFMLVVPFAVLGFAWTLFGRAVKRANTEYGEDNWPNNVAAALFFAMSGLLALSILGINWWRDFMKTL